ncbi:MAG: 3-isopropylmalate dehydrogenase, partial [Pseudomonadota bacterium]
MPHLLLLPGDGIGPEVMGATRRIIDHFQKAHGFTTEEALVGG